MSAQIIPFRYAEAAELRADVLPAPTVRITAKGVHRLYSALGGREAAA